MIFPIEDYLIFHYYFFSYINVYLKFFSIILGFRASLQSVLKMTKITIQSIYII